MEEVDPLLEPLRLEAAPLTDEDRAFFASRFLDQQRHFGEPYTWWVNERYLGMALHLGTPALGAALLQALRDLAPDPDDRRPREGTLRLLPGSEDRSRVQVISVLVRLTGWDARRDPAGQLRPIDDVASAYLGECRLTPPP